MAFEGEAAEKWLWTENRVHELRALIEERLTSGEIAARLGTSDGAVRQKAWRLGAELGQGRGRPRLTDEVCVARRASTPAPIRCRHWPPIPLPDLRSVETPDRARVTFLNLPEENACRWPIGPASEPGTTRTLFCGCSTHGAIYCPAHEELSRKSCGRQVMAA